MCDIIRKCFKFAKLYHHLLHQSISVKEKQHLDQDSDSFYRMYFQTNALMSIAVQQNQQYI